MKPTRVPWLALASVLALGPGRPASAACAYPTPVTAAPCQSAITYHAQNGGVSLLVRVNGQVVCEDYRTGSGPTVAHPVWSGTKSFSSAMAAAAIEDGLITSFAEVVANTITEWQGDPRKSAITLRQLLGLIGGLDANYGGTPTNVLGQIDEELSPGAIVFSKDNQIYRLNAIDAGDRLWFIIADGISGEETYGGGRFLYTDSKADSTGKVIVDSNKAYNPPCVLTKFATCPLPPKENYIKLRITAGEKVWGENH